MKTLKNNHGWGLKEMLILCAILVGFLLLVVVLVNKLYSGIEKNIKNDDIPKTYTYKEVETNITSAAKKYFQKNSEDIVYTDDLITEGYITIEKLTPKIENGPCDGYVLKIDARTYKAHIICDRYETPEEIDGSDEK